MVVYAPAAWRKLPLFCNATRTGPPFARTPFTPTVTTPPPKLGSFASPEDDPLAGIFKAAEFAPFTAPFNATGQPAASLPLYHNADGLPIGVQLVGAYGREDVILRVAAQLEALQPFVHSATRRA